MPPDTRGSQRALLRHGWTLPLSLCAGLLGCAHWPLPSQPAPQEPLTCAQDAPIYQSAHEESIRYLEREVERLQADLHQAEEAITAIESGMRSAHSRADAVSGLAESRIALNRAERAAPWRAAQIREARAKLEEAERQFQAGHSGSAIFFASRARRIAENLQEEASRVAAEKNTRFIDRPAVRLRAGPSTDDAILTVLKSDTPVFAEREQDDWVLVRTPAGPVGWVYGSLLRTH